MDFKIYIGCFFMLMSSVVLAEEQKLSLAKAIEIMEDHHPEITARRARIEETQANEQATPSLPPPMFLYGGMRAGAVPFDSNMRMEDSFEISQTIPFPTKLTSESNVRKYENLEAQAELKAQELKLRSQVKVAYFELFGARKKQMLLIEKQSVLENYYERIRAISLSDRIVQSYRISVQTELELIKNLIIATKEEIQVASGKLNVALGNDPFVSVPDLEDSPLSNLPSSSDQLAQTHPEIQSIEATQRTAEASLHLSKALWLPDFWISYRYANRQDGLMPNYSETMVGITLPFVFFWEPKGQVSAANAKIKQTQAKIVQTKNDLNLQLLEAKTHAESLREQLLNYETQILPQAEKRMKISQGLVPSEITSLIEFRSAIESVVDLKLALLNLRIEYEKSIAELESLLADSSQERKL